MLSDYISKEERYACVKAGALAYAAEQDIERGPLEKEALAIDAASAGVDTAKGILALAAIGAGIPLGVFSHVMGRRISGKRLREEELKERIRIYQTAADDMAAGLQGGQ